MIILEITFQCTARLVPDSKGALVNKYYYYYYYYYYIKIIITVINSGQTKIS